jgi:hypothetical protein
LPREIAQNGVERCRTQFCRAARRFGHGREFHLCRQKFTSLVPKPL